MSAAMAGMKTSLLEGGGGSQVCRSQGHKHQGHKHWDSGSQVKYTTPGALEGGHYTGIVALGLVSLLQLECLAHWPN